MAQKFSKVFPPKRRSSKLVLVSSLVYTYFNIELTPHPTVTQRKVALSLLATKGHLTEGMLVGSGERLGTV